MVDQEEKALAMRRALVASIASRPPWPGSGPWDDRVLAATMRVPRHAFVPRASLEDAYTDAPLAIGHGQTISQPTIVAVMSQALELSPSHTVLEIGTGCGYQAAVLSLLSGEVRSIEVVADLAREADARLRRLGYPVKVRHADGHDGDPDAAPFDRIILTAAPPVVPDALLEQIVDGGVLLAPVGADGSVQALVRHRRVGRRFDVERLAPVRFVPMVGGAKA